MRVAHWRTERAIGPMILCLLTMVVLGAVLSGCRKTALANESSITVSGSTSVAALMEVLGKAWQRQLSTPAVVEVQGTGSSSGIRAIRDGTSQIGMSSRNVALDELSEGISYSLLAYDGIAVVVNNDNPVQDLSLEALAKIYRGEIDNWQQVGGENSPIVVITRDPASGTRTAFEAIVGLRERDNNGNSVSTIARTAQVGAGNGTVKMITAQNRFAIGYVSLGSLDGTLKAVTIDGVQASSENIERGSYLIARPFMLLSANQKATALSEEFLDWLNSKEAQEIVSDHGYIPAN